MEVKYFEIRDLVSRGKFRAVQRIELPDGANLITAIYALVINQTKIRKIDIRKDTLLVGI